MFLENQAAHTMIFYTIQGELLPVPFSFQMNGAGLADTAGIEV